MKEEQVLSVAELGDGFDSECVGEVVDVGLGLLVDLGREEARRAVGDEDRIGIPEE